MDRLQIAKDKINASSHFRQRGKLNSFSISTFGKDQLKRIVRLYRKRIPNNLDFVLD